MRRGVIAGVASGLFDRVVATMGLGIGVIEGARGGDAVLGHNRDGRLVHAVHDDLNFVYTEFRVCDCNGASFEDGRDVVLSLNVSGCGVGRWRWGISAAELFLDIAFKYL